jgi:hypothetical protein
MAVNAPPLAAGALAPVDGAVDAAAAVLAPGDVVELEQAAKTTAKDAAKTAPLIDHLVGAWDILPISSSELQARTACLPVRPVERAGSLSEAEAPGAGSSEA